MVRARVVKHPCDWTHSGYRESQNPSKRYGIIDLRELSSLCGFSEMAEFQQAHHRWIDDSLTCERTAREGRWSEAIAVGNLNFVERVKSELGFKAAHLEVIVDAALIEAEFKIQNRKSKIDWVKLTGPILPVKMGR
jgi:putative transposase